MSEVTNMYVDRDSLDENSNCPGSCNSSKALVSNINSSCDCGVTKYVDKAQKAGRYLSQIIHTNECRGSCGDQHCLTRFRLISHCKTCSLGDRCVIAGCFTTKQIIRHRENCYMEEQAAQALGIEKKECLICAVARKHYNSFEVSSSYPPSLEIKVPEKDKSNYISRTPVSVTSLDSPETIHQRRKSMDSPSSRIEALSASYSNAMDITDDQDCNNYMPESRMSDGCFVRPTMLPKRFRCASASEVDLRSTTAQFQGISNPGSPTRRLW